MYMRTWNNKLYFDRMPGRTREAHRSDRVADWLDEMKHNGITSVVCLAPEEDIAAQSPEYRRWRLEQREAADYELIDFPIPDFNPPQADAAPAFWALARILAQRVEDGQKFFVHCGAGRGRTGTMAVAILMAMGKSYDEAYQAINAAGSYPETPEQKAFLKAGPAKPANT